MANCAIFVKGSDEITYFIRDCVQDGRNFRGSNGSFTGVKEYLFDTKWTEDIANPVKEEGRFKGYDKKVSQLGEALRYAGAVVSNRQDVNKVVQDQIREKYSLADELKLNRLRDKEWKEYNDFVEGVLNPAREFKDKHFPKGG